MKISRSRRSGSRLQWDVEVGGATVPVRLRVPVDLPTDDSGDPAVPLGWFPAMRRGEPLVVAGDVSPRLAAGAERLAEILLTWDRSLHPGDHRYRKVALDARRRAAPTGRAAAGQTACFFTGGADSFYSVVRNRAEIDALVFVHGFDLHGRRDSDLNRLVSAELNAAADLLGLPLLEIEAHLNRFGRQRQLSWTDYHGAAMATVALALAPRFGRFLVPASSTYATLYPHGSHPLTDPLWSTERVELVHDGADATRADKLAAIAAEPAARRHLRVCFKNPDGAYNCGRCEKCLRTWVAARIAGVHDHFETLPQARLRQVARARIPGRGLTWTDYQNELTRTGAIPNLRRAIDVALLRRRVREYPIVGRWVK